MFDSAGVRLTLAAVALLLPGVGAVADAACDNTCRMRFDHYIVGNQTYRTFNRDSCLFCAGFSLLCEQKSGDLGGGCGPSGQMAVTVYETGTQVCTPAVNTTTVEAKANGGSILDTFGTDRYVCALGGGNSG